MKFFFDNNLPPSLPRALNELCERESHQAVALKDKFDQNIKDVEWIECLSNEKDWIVLTHDNLNKGLEREALRRAGLVVFFLDKSWVNHNYWEKASQLIKWWPKIMEQAERIQGGAAFKVPWNLSGKGKFEQLRF